MSSNNWNWRLERLWRETGEEEIFEENCDNEYLFFEDNEENAIIGAKEFIQEVIATDAWMFPKNVRLLETIRTNFTIVRRDGLHRVSGTCSYTPDECMKRYEVPRIVAKAREDQRLAELAGVAEK